MRHTSILPRSWEFVYISLWWSIVGRILQLRTGPLSLLLHLERGLVQFFATLFLQHILLCERRVVQLPWELWEMFPLFFLAQIERGGWLAICKQYSFLAWFAFHAEGVADPQILDCMAKLVLLKTEVLGLHVWLSGRNRHVCVIVPWKFLDPQFGLWVDSTILPHGFLTLIVAFWTSALDRQGRLILDWASLLGPSYLLVHVMLRWGLVRIRYSLERMQWCPWRALPLLAGAQRSRWLWVRISWLL